VIPSTPGLQERFGSAISRHPPHQPLGRIGDGDSTHRVASTMHSDVICYFRHQNPQVGVMVPGGKPPLAMPKGGVESARIHLFKVAARHINARLHVPNYPSCVPSYSAAQHSSLSRGRAKSPIPKTKRPSLFYKDIPHRYPRPSQIPAAPEMKPHQKGPSCDSIRSDGGVCGLPKGLILFLEGEGGIAAWRRLWRNDFRGGDGNRAAVAGTIMQGPKRSR
jgi:hypothetical protein